VKGKKRTTKKISEIRVQNFLAVRFYFEISKFCAIKKVRKYNLLDNFDYSGPGPGPVKPNKDLKIYKHLSKDFGWKLAGIRPGRSGQSGQKNHILEPGILL
jgi:hypothetical protein